MQEKPYPTVGYLSMQNCDPREELAQFSKIFESSPKRRTDHDFYPLMTLFYIDCIGPYGVSFSQLAANHTNDEHQDTLSVNLNRVRSHAKAP